MPPRIPLPSRLGVSNLCFRPAPKSSHPSITSSVNASSLAQRLRHKDPYALAQAKQRRAANQGRQDVLQKERLEALGDPVRGLSTPFLESFDDVGGSTDHGVITAIESPEKGVQLHVAENVLLNHFLQPSELVQAVEHSQSLTKPASKIQRDHADPQWELKEHEKWIDGHARAATAIARIASLANSSQKDKTRANIRRCIETFGRHNTDSQIRPRAPVNSDVYGSANPEKTPRAGPDTGSSEVQIAILTAKIRVLANQLEAHGGKNDKVNKRNLRLLVHKRQKHLKYLRTKERGSDRWQNLIEKLGLTEGTWKGEISL